MHFIRTIVSLTIAVTMLPGVFSGCAKAPEQELAAAKAAVKAAQTAEAEKYMPNNFKNVQKALEAAETEVVQQNNSFILSRNYSKAKKLLENVTNLAADLKNEAPKAKAEIVTQVEEGLVAIQRKAKDARVDVKKAPRSLGKKVKEKMAADLDAADSAISQASTLFSEGNVIDARQKISDAQRLLKGISDKLSTGGGMSLM